MAAGLDPARGSGPQNSGPQGSGPQGSGPQGSGLTIGHILQSGLARRPGTEIVYRDQVRHTYPEFAGRVARLGAALDRLGASAGTVVAVMDWDSHRYLECFFAVPMQGAVLQTVNVRLSVEQILYTLTHARAEILFCNAEFLSLLQGLRPLLTTVRRFICLTDTGEVPAGFAWDGEYETLLRDADPDHRFPDLDEDTRATVFYTTGTTGLPKGVFFTHRQIVLQTLAASSMVGMREADVYMPITPMFHVHAWGVPFLATMTGVKQVYPGRYAPDLLLGLRSRERVSFSHCVPTILQMLLSHPAAAGTDLSGWRVIIGGSALPRPLARAALARGIDVVSGYGLSETCPLLTVSVLKPELRDGGETELAYRCRAGLPVPMVQLRVVDAAGRDLPPDGVSAGEILARAPWATEGYLGDPEATARLWAGGWLHTGDIGTIDPLGYLTITDRIKDVIKTGGEWVSSLQIEDILAEHPAVAEVAVIGVPDPVWGERPVAAVVLRPGAAADEAALRAHVAERVQQGVISKYAMPERIAFVDALARTSVGKLDKKAMRARFGV